MDLRELLIILLIATGGISFIWFETGRDPLLLKAAGGLLGAFALGGAVAVAVT